jgi:hydroxyacylglutathione hydrolase
LGDVGRPDLAQKAANMTMEDLAGMLYESLQSKIMPLADDVTVYPAHGAGSACGKNMQKETVDTLGNQKRTNYALNQPDKASFIKAVTEGLTAPPGYFGMNVAMNKLGYENFETVLAKANTPLNPEAFEAAAESTNAVILDTRNSGVFCEGFIPNAINIGIKGDFAPWVGAMIVDVKQPLLLVTDEGMQEEAITRLSRVGFDNVIGYLQGGVAAWAAAGKDLDKVDRIDAQTFEQKYTKDSIVVDVRKEGEYYASHVNEAYFRPLASINDWINDLPQDHFFLHCAGGYRSMIAASILQARGIRNFTEIDGGFNAIKNTHIPVSDFVCPSKVM